MSEAAQTLEGWYALHDFRPIDWTAWRLADANERNTALDELQSFLKQWQLSRMINKAVLPFIPSLVKKLTLFSCICVKR